MFKCLALLIVLMPIIAVAQSPRDRATALFADYQRRQSAFDPGAANLYCDTATIRNVLKYPDGRTDTLQFIGSKYKLLLRKAMPLAKSLGDRSRYSNIAYTPEGPDIRITATRYAVLKKYSSPISLLVGKCGAGDWAVLEEISESRP